MSYCAVMSFIQLIIPFLTVACRAFCGNSWFPSLNHSEKVKNLTSIIKFPIIYWFVILVPIPRVSTALYKLHG